MKKTIISLALAVFAVAGFSASAQTEKAACSKANCTKQACDKQLNENNRMRRPASWREFAFEGVLLSVEQQAKMDEINKEFESKFATACAKDTCSAAPKCDKADCKKADCKKDNCKKGECKKADGKKADGKKAGKGKRGFAPDFQVRNEYIAKVKQVLTPEQYTTFLENIINMPVQRNQGPDKNCKMQIRGRVGDYAACNHRHVKKDARDAKKVKDNKKPEKQTR